jgi:hypothetical protein
MTLSGRRVVSTAPTRPRFAGRSRKMRKKGIDCTSPRSRAAVVSSASGASETRTIDDRTIVATRARGDPGSGARERPVDAITAACSRSRCSPEDSRKKSFRKCYDAGCCPVVRVASQLIRTSDTRSPAVSALRPVAWIVPITHVPAWPTPPPLHPRRSRAGRALREQGSRAPRKSVLQCRPRTRRPPDPVATLGTTARCGRRTPPCDASATRSRPGADRRAQVATSSLTKTI